MKFIYDNFTTTGQEQSENKLLFYFSKDIFTD